MSNKLPLRYQLQQCLHVWWFALFCRILMGLLSGQSASDVGKQEYEEVGDSSSETGRGR